MTRKILALAIICFALWSCTKPQEDAPKYFTNPILAGFYPDPSIVKVGADFYMVTSTFVYFPGLPIFHSQDLVNWKLIGHVITDPAVLDVEGDGVSRGLFAPSIRYSEGKFYVTCTLIDKGGNFITTATEPAGPWSAPYWVQEVNGIDPSPFFDDDGKSYLVYNSIPPDNITLYGGHRSLRLWEFDRESMKVIGEEVLIVDGGTDISKKPVWIEAPHIFKKDGYYYLIAAEGGTAYQHSEVVFRSESVKGPYVPFSGNPILTQRHLDPDRPNPITTTGHADFIETDNGEWWAVFLGCRPYTGKEFFNTGRETFLAPVRWVDGWPIINPDFEEVQHQHPLPLPTVDLGARPQTGEFTYRDEFDAQELDKAWMFLRSPKEKWHSLSGKNGWLSISLLSATCTDKTNPAFIGHRQQHLVGSASTAMQFQATTENEKAGLLVFQSENNFYFLCKSIVGDKQMVQLFQSPPSGEETMLLIEEKEIGNDGTTIQLKIASQSETYAFHYAMEGKKWETLKAGVDAKFLSTQTAGGFVGCIYAMYATSLGLPSDNVAHFDWFEHENVM